MNVALEFWAATRTIERFFYICGDDLLGMDAMCADIGPCRRNPLADSVPVTPIMDTQVDELAINVLLVPLKTRLLQLLKCRILAKKREYWYEIYLASFVVLHNVERVADHIADYARRFGLTVS